MQKLRQSDEFYRFLLDVQREVSRIYFVLGGMQALAGLDMMLHVVTVPLKEKGLFSFRVLVSLERH